MSSQSVNTIKNSIMPTTKRQVCDEINTPGMNLPFRIGNSYNNQVKD